MTGEKGKLSVQSPTIYMTIKSDPFLESLTIGQISDLIQIAEKNGLDVVKFLSLIEDIDTILQGRRLGRVQVLR